MTDNREKENPSVSRICGLLDILAREGSIAVSEIAPRLHVSSVTAAHITDALRAGGLAVWGREYACGTRRDRKLRLNDAWQLSAFHIGAHHVRTLDHCPATGACARRSITLCDAIPREEALLAEVSRLLVGARRSPGVILEDGVVLPDSVLALLGDAPIAVQSELTAEAIARAYPTGSVLYLRYGDTPTVRLFSDGICIPALRIEDHLRCAWGIQRESRMLAMTKQTADVLALLSVDVLLLEADGIAIEDLRARLQEAVDKTLAQTRVIGVEKLALCEREMLERLCRATVERMITNEKR